MTAKKKTNEPTKPTSQQDVSQLAKSVMDAINKKLNAKLRNDYFEPIVEAVLSKAMGAATPRDQTCAECGLTAEQHDDPKQFIARGAATAQTEYEGPEVGG